MGDLENGPHHFVLLLSLMRCILRILHLVLELEQRILDVLEALWRRLPVSGTSTVGRHIEVVAVEK